MNIRTYITAAALALVSAGYSQQTKEDSLLIQRCIDFAMEGTEEGMQKAMAQVRVLAGKGKEHHLMKAAEIAFILGYAPQSDSILKVAIQKYPKGEAARGMALSNVYNKNGNAIEMEAAYTKWKKDFPKKQEDKQTEDDASAKIGAAFAAERNYKQMAKWFEKISDNMLLAQTEIETAETAFNNGDTAVTTALLAKGVPRLRQAASDEMYRNQLNAYLQRYAVMLYKLRQYPEALAVSSEVYQSSANKKASLQREHSMILVANGKGKEALPILAALLKQGQSDAQLNQALQDAYLDEKGSLEGFQAYKSALREEMVQHVRNGLSQKMINEEAPQFALKDQDGKTVSLADMKGKIVVLDFWATWCGPCKESFPAMKMAVEKFHADTNVHFLFVDCMERVKDPKAAVMAFIHKNNYPFHVLFDTDLDPVAKRYGIKGIPTKLVIDGNGKIRFRMVGFEGGADAAVEELSALIEITKQQQEETE